MRLVIDARMLEHSGIGTYLCNVLPGVLRRCAKFQPLLLTLPHLAARANELGSLVADVRPWAAPPLSIQEIAPPREVERDDLWWSPHYNVPLMPGPAMVVTLHDLLPLNDAHAKSGLHKRAAVRLWLNAIRRRSRRVICVSQFTRSEAARLGRIPADRMSVVHLGVASAWSRPGPERNPRDAPYLAFVGLVKPHKNLLGVLRAFETLIPTIPHRLMVVGRHTGLRDVDQAALALARRLGNRVSLVENIPLPRLIELVRGADLLVHPSFQEGFGLSPLEAMAAGTPVLAARTGAIPEVCGDAAAYCDPRSHVDIARSILRLINDPAQREAMIERGRTRARSFTWDACAEGTSRALIAAWNER